MTIGPRAVRLAPRAHPGESSADTTPAATTQLIRRYRLTQDPALQAQLVALHEALVQAAARRHLHAGEPLEDLLQVGRIGLLQAIDRYDCDRGARFASYATTLIEGEIRHHIRDHGAVIRRPRWLFRLGRELDDAVACLREDGSGREPAIDDIARLMNITPQGVHEILRARAAASPLALDDERDGGPPLRNTIRHQRYEAFQLPIEDRILIMEAAERLTEIQRKVIYALFYLDLTETEAARRLRVSQKHVSRMLNKALQKLRQGLAEA